MIETINKHQFSTRFNEVRPGAFSNEALDCLYNYLESIEDDTGQTIEFDPIAFCGDFSEVHRDEVEDDGDIIAELSGDRVLIVDT